MIGAAGSVSGDCSTKFRDHGHDRFCPMRAEPVPEGAQGCVRSPEAQGELAIGGALAGVGIPAIEKQRSGGGLFGRPT